MSSPRVAPGDSEPSGLTARRAAPWLATALVCGVAAAARWRLAAFADWGIDESANLWLGSLILDGNAPTVGLSSSRGVLNLAGAPLLAAPLARLPDLLAVSRALYRSMGYRDQGGVFLGGWSDPEQPGVHIVDPLTIWLKEL